MSELINRFFSETPKFFKKVRAVCIAVGSLSTIIVTSGLALPESWTFLIAQAGIIAGIIGALIASLPVKDTADIVDTKTVILSVEDTINPDGKDNPKTKP